MNDLMQKVMQGKATKEEKVEFGIFWQDRVKSILENPSKVVTIS